MEAAAWSGINVVNLKNNKVLDIGNLPAAWLELTRLYLGMYSIVCSNTVFFDEIKNAFPFNWSVQTFECE